MTATRPAPRRPRRRRRRPRARPTGPRAGATGAAAVARVPGRPLLRHGLTAHRMTGPPAVPRPPDTTVREASRAYAPDVAQVRKLRPCRSPSRPTQLVEPSGGDDDGRCRRGAKSPQGLRVAGHCRMQPWLCGVPSSARVCTRSPSADRDVVEADGGVVAVGEADHVPHRPGAVEAPGLLGAASRPSRCPGRGCRRRCPRPGRCGPPGRRRATSQTRWSLMSKTTRRPAPLSAGTASRSSSRRIDSGLVVRRCGAASSVGAAGSAESAASAASWAEPARSRRRSASRRRRRCGVRPGAGAVRRHR